MKKRISLALAFLMMLLLAVPAFAEEDGVTLQFGKDGKFTILSVCDIQDVYPMSPITLAFLREALAETKPDIVVLGGDNLVCRGTEIFDEMLAPFVEANVPFTLVFGNHDREFSDLSREEQLAEYQRVGGRLCLAYDAVPSLSGCATHNLPVLSSDGKRTAFNLWMFDSGDYDPAGGYDRVHRDQIDWYIENSQRLERENGAKVPSLAFQHIIVKEIFDAVYVPSKNAKKPFRTFADGTTFTPFVRRRNVSGMLIETPCPSSFNDGEWAAFVERGDVLGCVTGHDHINNFIVNYKGVDLIQTSAAGQHAYGTELTRGVRVITLDERNLQTYETHTVYESQLAAKPHSTIAKAAKLPRFLYRIVNLVRPLADLLF